MDKFKKYINKLSEIHKKYGNEIIDFYIDCYECFRIQLENGDSIILEPPSCKVVYIDHEAIEEKMMEETKKKEEKEMKKANKYYREMGWIK